MNGSHVMLEGVSKNYAGVPAVCDVNLSIDRGEFVVLLGPSGSGKTTLLSILGGFVEPTSGRVVIGGRDATLTPPARRPTSTVFQDYAL
ncbi:MAG: ATP-binding cassette domain-containing protein, partial [Gammaproteobacteria bacterium]|nr:ATP-binding cassette domain-containing protein [Gammaproteobacteria bacterium]